MRKNFIGFFNFQLLMMLRQDRLGGEAQEIGLLDH